MEASTKLVFTPILLVLMNHKNQNMTIWTINIWLILSGASFTPSWDDHSNCFGDFLKKWVAQLVVKLSETQRKDLKIYSCRFLVHCFMVKVQVPWHRHQSLRKNSRWGRNVSPVCPMLKPPMRRWVVVSVMFMFHLENGTIISLLMMIPTANMKNVCHACIQPRRLLLTFAGDHAIHIYKKSSAWQEVAVLGDPLKRGCADGLAKDRPFQEGLGARIHCIKMDKTSLVDRFAVAWIFLVASADQFHHEVTIRCWFFEGLAILVSHLWPGHEHHRLAAADSWTQRQGDRKHFWSFMHIFLFCTGPCTPTLLPWSFKSGSEFETYISHIDIHDPVPFTASQVYIHSGGVLMSLAPDLSSAKKVSSMRFLERMSTLNVTNRTEAHETDIVVFGRH